MAQEHIRILLIEDNAGDVRLMQAHFEEARQFKYELVVASRLSQAAAVVQETPIDVVLLDLSLPDAEGMETVTRMHAIAPDLPIVVLTGLDDETLATQTVHQGAQDYLVKGKVDAEILGRAVRYAVERKRAQDNARRLIREQAAREEAEVAWRRFRFLSDASRELAFSLEYEHVLGKVAELAVPFLADCCFVDVLDEHGALRRTAAAHSHAANPALMRLAELVPPALSEEHPIVRAIRQREPRLLEAIPDDFFVDVTKDPDAHALLAHLKQRSAMILPIVARGETLAVITLLSKDAAHRYDSEDLALGLDFAGRAGLALDNAKLYHAREEVLAVVSHDLRTPLNVITMTTASLFEWERMPEARRIKHLQKIERSAERMDRLIQDLLDVTRIDAGSLPLERDRYNVAALVYDAVEMLRPLADDKSIRLGCVLPKNELSSYLDRERMLQVLSNLLGNAIKFTPENGAIDVEVSPLGGNVCVSVKDNGPGIAQEHLARIFDRFWQAKRTDRRGSGLGLAIAKGIVLAHGGRIWVESEVGAGCCFSVSLPLHTATAPAMELGSYESLKN